MKRNYFKTIGSSVFIVGAVIILVLLVTWQPSTPAPDYTQYTVVKRDIERTLELSGRVMADQRVQLYASEYDIVDIEAAEDQSVQLSIPALDTTVAGGITSLSAEPRISGDVTDYEVLIEFSEDSPDHLRSGMHVDANITLASQEDVIAVPNSSLFKDDDDYFVNIVEEQRRVYVKRLGWDKREQTLRAVKVTTGFEGNEYTEITDGLNVGEVVAYD